eukprot:scaffold1634_cov137-Amphora_coffeaeformis.AAC.2
MPTPRSHRETMTVGSVEDNGNDDVDLIDFESKRKKQYIPIEEKISLVLEAERLVKAEKKMSWKGFCKEHQINLSNLRKWSRNVVKMKQRLDETHAKKSKVSMSPGRPSSISDIAPPLIPWVKAVRAGGAKVSVQTFLAKKEEAHSYAIVCQLLKANNIAITKATHKAQADFAGTAETALQFVQGTRPFFAQANRHPAFILNMDQTPYNVNDPPNETLNERGVKTVNAKAPKSSVGRITANLCVAANKHGYI